VKVYVGGKVTELEEGTSLSDFMQCYGFTARQAIVVLNDEVVHGNVWGDTVLGEGDYLELVSLVGGG
jgi:sulfur carrier protein